LAIDLVYNSIFGGDQLVDDGEEKKHDEL